MKTIVSFCFVWASLTLNSPAFGFPNIRDAWELIYPESSSIALDCQLCHANAAGFEPWNAYGWDIRESIQSGESREDAILLAEIIDHDIDDFSIESFEEIIRNFQPGWRTGNNNTLFFKDGSTTSNQPPPILPPPPPGQAPQTAIDFPDAIDDPITIAIPSSPTTLTLDEVAGGFSSAVRAVKAPGIDGSLFVIEQGGRIFRTDLASGVKTLFADVSGSLVGCNECGLLGLAFHPNYQSNGLFYTYQSEQTGATPPDFTTLITGQTPNHQSKIIEYRTSDASCNSFVSKRRVLLTIDQPQPNHNGGDLIFDDSGDLYISLGDGGGASDFGRGHGDLGNGRDNETILGTILRIDPLGNNSDNGQYGIPADNPFVDISGIDEIYAFGFRNPFRISFDANTGELYAADVGQDDIEEIDRVISGGNYGWNWKEGSFFFYYFPVDDSTTRFVSDVVPPGLPDDLIDPVGQYDHDEGVSITGGYVYRGAAIDTVLGSGSTQGKYVFADLTGGVFEMDTASGELREFSITNGSPGLITGFGQDADNELYLVTGAGTGSLFKITEEGDAPFAPAAEGESAICPPSEDLCWSIVTASGSTASLCL